MADELVEAKRHIRNLMRELQRGFSRGQCPSCWTLDKHDEECEFDAADRFLKSQPHTGKESGG